MSHPPIERRLYLYADADAVRVSMEKLLFEERVDELCQFSFVLQKTIEATASSLIQSFGGRIVFAAGDDILLILPVESYDCNVVRTAMTAFAGATGCTLSIGVGRTINECYLNLRRAKSFRGDALFESLYEIEG